MRECRLTKKAQARGRKSREQPATSRQTEGAIPRCLQRLVRPQHHILNMKNQPHKHLHTSATNRAESDDMFRQQQIRMEVETIRQSSLVDAQRSQTARQVNNWRGVKVWVARRLLAIAQLLTQSAQKIAARSNEMPVCALARRHQLSRHTARVLLATGYSEPPATNAGQCQTIVDSHSLNLSCDVLRSNEKS